MTAKRERSDEAGELAALAPDHPLRVEFEERVEREGGNALLRWQALLAENQRWRDGLAEVPVPSDLADRIMNKTPGPPRRRLSRQTLAIIAVCSLAVVSFIALHYAIRGTRTDLLASVAVANHWEHQLDHGVPANGSDKVQLEADLTRDVGFSAQVPQRVPLTLAGGRRCELAGHPVALTLWRDGQNEYSVFQFQPRKFGLAQSIEPTLVDVPAPARGFERAQVWIWTEGPAAYVMAGDPNADLPRIAPAPR